MTQAGTATQERRGFEAEVSRLLHLMVHSVYSDREIFLRELVSNASDACDKLRYEAITAPDLLSNGTELAIAITADPKAGTLTIADTGIGMDREDLIANLGTIARSGTAAFLDRLSGDKSKDLSLIGQFGVGFYSSFMVADKVRVISRKAGTEQAYQWESDGEGSYIIDEAEKAGHGTEIILHLKDDAKDFLERPWLERTLRKYSDHIAVPISLKVCGTEKDGETDKAETVNSGSALWTRPKSELSDDDYTEFYRHVAHSPDEPALVIHTKAEGVISYSALLFVPGQRPLDLFDPSRKPRVKLYVKRVFITDDTEELLPGYLRFLKGVVDSEDLALNISREMLQNNPVVARIRKAVTNKVLSEIEKRANKDKDAYEKIWEAFGPVLKEGLYEDAGRRDTLLKLSRFKSTHGDAWVSLADYVGRMKDNQKAIYYVTGTDAEAVKRSPQLEGFRARDVEVLLLSDPVDDFWLSAISEFDGKPFKSVTRGGSDLKDLSNSDSNTSDEAKSEDDTEDMVALSALLKGILGDQVADVRSSDRLTETAACLVADDNGLDMHLERILRQHNQMGGEAPKVLEINPNHPLIKAMDNRKEGDNPMDSLRDPAFLLLDQARILEGETPTDPAAFAKRLARLMEKGLPAI
ncbi:chaperone protein HtpG [Iodidimonas gelatinilytica]|uniref:Chaperone protein HtpG n=1 Tax=Iodidimonas gelatinilytica TaxID=1236966 RepID=A0A5A7MUL8_9PROT|nr:molecular chaperone HtpG [Iodidimonas gelatinilytica]GEQ99617.1 chaperone protein HtpG [Iodidimonas gelatinilytica]